MTPHQQMMYLSDTSNGVKRFNTLTDYEAYRAGISAN